jgi:hypothetical protein
MHPNILLALIPSLILAAGCAASSSSTLDAELNVDFDLQHGQSAQIAGAELSVGFIDVVSDSRCGKGENCITAGDGVVRIWLEAGSGSRQEDTLHTRRDGPGVVSYAGYEVRLVALNPPRISGVVIPAADYRITLRVER